MYFSGHRFPNRFAFCVVVGLCGFSNTTQAVTPQSPEVRTMVNRAVRYLSDDHIYDEPHRALAAMAVYKSGEPETHPLVAKAIEECLDLCRTPETVDATLRSVYAVAVVGLFLSEIDPQRFEKEISNILRSLEKRQKPFGGWGYPKPDPNWEYGDTSMTQYAVLCAWMIRSVGVAEVSREAVRKVTNWLIRTQDPSGAWGYQGRDPGSYTQRLPQQEVRHSLCAAGVGSLYICSSMLGFTTDTGLVLADDELPPALRPVLKASPRTPDSNVDEGLLKRAIRGGNRWYENNYRINPEEYAMYYLYTLERYQSFKEAAEGRAPREPRWYNDGVRYLKSQQQRDGSWDMPGGTGGIADTAFGILFLVRSAQATLAKASDEYAGLLVAGRGLPNNARNVQLKRGRVVTTPFQGTANTLLEILNNDEHPDFDSATQLEAIPLSEDSEEREQQQKRMRRLARAESHKVRLVAVKTLAKIRNLDNVPTLIYALSDPDLRVMIAARNGLRFLGRKFTGFGLSDTPTAEQRRAAIEAWKQWYHRIRPDAFMENG